jgi:hypothetical protein
VPAAFTDCESGNDQFAGSPAAATRVNVDTVTPVTLLDAVAAVQPDGAVTVVADAPPDPVLTVRSSKYHGTVRLLFEYVIVTIAVPAAGVGARLGLLSLALGS